MSILLALVLAPSATDDGLGIYRCQNLESGQVFVLSFDNKGKQVRNVEIHIDGVPRIGGDNETKWRGSIDSDGVIFQLSNFKNRAGTIGNMSLKWNSADEMKARLTWESTSGGGHIWLAEQQQSAECTMFVPETSVLK